MFVVGGVSESGVLSVDWGYGIRKSTGCVVLATRFNNVI
jgi:hypothetical protein